ncbi:MAG: RND family efflux transporter MFP subunit [Microgenomates group bacterium GW2011_GWA1_48_10]|uniref:Uncharacterized protein n=1 Tax=Candidatus Gottesmanbacteria bacterium RIFCSPHIGHO2_01_FULL_47_48 TaxID=1798381 RepID=A0A1F6A5B6_9BACT|nr:MAG: RND family efflux transporter MFP subunit [Microgenomates group bacterium GW2011_GWA1_48_10]OGG19664.1 MAG: hypothetical protein A2721_00930 [Candidatus Gottesmanbacteria bacterium RIFCSPHIGHO2_01_FULL_47_48]
MNRFRPLLRDKQKLVLALVALFVVVFGLWKFFGPKTATPQYQTATVERGNIVSTISASGQVITTGRLPILSQASGQVSAVYVKNGDTLTAGQKILTITLDPGAAVKNASAWSSYLSANAAFYSTQSTMFSKWKTYLDLATNSTYENPDQSPNETNRTAAAFHIAQDDWLKAEADYKNQQAVVNASWLNYQQTSPDLVAPTSGILEDLTYVPGMLISSSVSSSGITQSQTIASVVTTFSPTIAINLSEVDVNKVSEGNKVTVTFDALPDKTYTGKIVGINKTGVVSSGVTNYPATIQLDTSPAEILPNMSASANIILATKSDVLLIPSEAVQTQDGQAVVRVLKNGQEALVNVETGLTSDTQTEITSGLNEGDTVVTGTATTTPTTTSQSPFSTFRIGGGIGGAGGGTRIQTGR